MAQVPVIHWQSVVGISGDLISYLSFFQAQTLSVWPVFVSCDIKFISASKSQLGRPENSFLNFQENILKGEDNWAEEK